MTRSRAPLILTGLAGLIALGVLALLGGGFVGPGSGPGRRTEVEPASPADAESAAEL